ncbi:hypothetical protein VTJ04DRAFT_8787 [Mycothermus thermophilus]|uniref:uncharacterized protein n=1 Tax=Humicola insolens TaxID=85995 RepID=UPI003741F210
MRGKLFSPYARPRRRSPRLVLVWLGTFFFLLFLVWYLNTRHREASRAVVEEFLHPGSVAAWRAAEAQQAQEKGQGHVGGPVAAAKAVVEEGREEGRGGGVGGGEGGVRFGSYQGGRVESSERAGVD